MTTNDFKVGDKAIFSGKISGTNFEFTDVEVEILQYSAMTQCRFPDGERWYVNKNQLRPSSISSQSPQPQPNQIHPKEEYMKPYAVIYHGLTTQSNGSINSLHTTEQEAREAAEVLVASQRANLTTKQYFAVTIVNTKTGELVGSVVDAPPAVDWKK